MTALRSIGLWLLPWLAFGCHAAEPAAVSCAEPKGQVAQLLCTDAELQALDLRLNQVYQAAQAKAKDGLVTRLRSEQRGWLKGRAECWKAVGQPVWLTASWTVSTVRDCSLAITQQRIAELQAVWALLDAVTEFYQCQNNPANEVVLQLFSSEPATIRLERGDSTRTLWRVTGVAEPMYEGQNVSLQWQGDQLQLNWFNIHTGQNELLQCQKQPSGNHSP
ncbi:lysozyme inhibitor LprI family protein [Rheinheimera sp.]|uniref:lysozyme inhibitor LprI family protein n=1 Tax=Rheinheimera sp. TaxID=1869214 RepID=UPI00307F9EA8